jgi:hypothetical protein
MGLPSLPPNTNTVAERYLSSEDAMDDSKLFSAEAWVAFCPARMPLYQHRHCLQRHDKTTRPPFARLEHHSFGCPDYYQENGRTGRLCTSMRDAFWSSDCSALEAGPFADALPTCPRAVRCILTPPVRTCCFASSFASYATCSLRFPA